MTTASAPARGEQHPRRVQHLIEEGADHADPGAEAVAHDDQPDVGHHQGERGEPGDPVHPGELVLTPGLLDDRDARHEQHLQQHQRRGQQTGQPPDVGQAVTHRAEGAQATPDDPQRHDEQHHDPREPGRGIAPPPRHRRHHDRRERASVWQ